MARIARLEPTIIPPMSGTARGSVKGSVLQSRVAFVREAKGDTAVGKVFGRLPVDDRKILEGLIVPAGWYPFDLNDRLDHSIAEEMGIGDRIFRQLGEKSANDNLAASHKIFIRDKDPHGLLKQAATIYRLYYDTGHRTYEKSADREAFLRTHDSLSFSLHDCLTVVGWHEKAILMCGGRNASVVETKCRARGEALCEYRCRWE